jgi:hypothetical protein
MCGRGVVRIPRALHWAGIWLPRWGAALARDFNSCAVACLGNFWFAVGTLPHSWELLKNFCGEIYPQIDADFRRGAQRQFFQICVNLRKSVDYFNTLSGNPLIEWEGLAD